MSAGDLDGGSKPIAHWRTIMLVVTAVLGAAVLVAVILTLKAADRQRDRALELQSKSYEVMILASNLSGMMADAEASLGRYVVSTDKQLGQLYSDQWSRAGGLLDQLDRAVRDRPAQRQRVAALRRAYERRGEELSMTALNTLYHQNNQALNRYYHTSNSQPLTDINRLLKQITGAERGLLAARSDAVARSLAHANRVVAILIVFGVMIVLGALALGWMAVRAIAERATARAEADLERARVGDLEAAVAAATAELQEQEARLRQVQKMEAVGQLTGGIAHDFNNMLAVVLGGLELAKRHISPADEEVRRHIDNAAEGADRAAALTKRLLAFSRAEPVKPEPIEVRGLISGMSSLLDRTLGDGIIVETRDDGRGWSAWADRHQLENAILNLAVNARDAMEARGRLVIASGGASLAADAVGHCAAGDYVTIAVTDTGCGMAPDVRERVFEPFFTTKPVGKGTGLGLSQIFAFVRQNEGEIAIESTPGLGTTVTIYLPRRQAAEPVVSIQPTTAAALETPAGLEIMVVEDDPRVLAATMGALRELGHHPTGCGDPLKAETMIDAHGAVDLVITDVLMPGRTGPELIAGIAPRYPHVAILFVTGYAGETGAEALADRVVLRKPFTINALDRAVGEAMAVARPIAPHRVAAE